MQIVEELYLLHGKLSPAFLQRKLKITLVEAERLIKEFFKVKK
jgi:hypothetical protein